MSKYYIVSGKNKGYDVYFSDSTVRWVYDKRDAKQFNSEKNAIHFTSLDLGALICGIKDIKVIPLDTD